MNSQKSFVKTFLLACIGVLFLSSCEKDPNGNLTGIGSNSGLAPKSVVGKTFHGDFYFETETTFTYVDFDDDIQRIIGTPTYTYIKTSDDTAELSFEYTYEIYGYTGYLSSLNETSTFSNIFYLYFTSKTAGWYISGNNGNRVNFTLE